MLEAVEGERYLLEVLEVPEVMRRVLLCMLEVLKGGLCLLIVPDVIRVRCVLLSTLEAVDGGLCLLEVLAVLEGWMGWMCWMCWM